MIHAISHIHQEHSQVYRQHTFQSRQPFTEITNHGVHRSDLGLDLTLSLLCHWKNSSIMLTLHDGASYNLRESEVFALRTMVMVAYSVSQKVSDEANHPCHDTTKYA